MPYGPLQNVFEEEGRSSWRPRILCEQHTLSLHDPLLGMMVGDTARKEWFIWAPTASPFHDPLAPHGGQLKQYNIFVVRTVACIPVVAQCETM